MKRITAWLLMLALLALPAAALGASEGTGAYAADVTDQSVLTVPDSAQPFVGLLTDGAAHTYVDFRGEASLTATVPEPGSAGLVLKWETLPDTYTLRVLDAGGQTVSDETVSPAFLNMYHALPETAASVTVTAAEDFSLSELTVYGAGELPPDVQRWEKPDGAPDVLIVAAYAGNVLECFGGLYPQLLADGVKTDVLYMSWRTRQRAEEALTALWTLGQTRYPYCLNREDRGANDADSVSRDWDSSDSRVLLSDALTAIQPSVVVSHGRKGDTAYESEATAFTAAVLTDALDSAAFRPQKVYFHENGDGATALTYGTPLWAYGGKTAVETAQTLFDTYRNTAVYRRTLTADNVYTLYQTQVGSDTGAGLLENIAFTPLFTPVPEPTATPEPTEEPTAVPDETPEPTATPEPVVEPIRTDAPGMPAAVTDDSGTPPVFLLILLGVGLLGSGVLFLLFGKLRESRGTSFALLIALLPILVTGIAAGAALGAASMKTYGEPAVIAAEATPEPTAEPTQEPTAEPTQEPTPEPTQEPTPEPTQEPAQEPAVSDKWADKFSETGEEQVSRDAENGVWSYRSDILAIEIERHATDEPLVWYVAHIYMRGTDSFRSAIAAPNYSGMFTIPSWKLARNNNAVLLITGDNLLNMDRDLKGILIRNGKVFMTKTKQSCLAFFPDSMTMKAYEKNTITCAQIQQYGVENVFSFGPILISDGQVQNVSKHRLHIDNPRTGVGMIEPGHFVAIVVDGRQPEYSQGNTLTEFAQMFVDEGCVEAYNLDGGVSATMVLMGEQLNHHGNNKKDWDKQRNVPDALIWGYSHNTPTIDDPEYGTGA